MDEIMIAIESLAGEPSTAFQICGQEELEKILDEYWSYYSVTLSDQVITISLEFGLSGFIADDVEMGFRILSAFRHRNHRCRVWLFPDITENRTFSQIREVHDIDFGSRAQISYGKVRLKIKEKYRALLDEDIEEGVVIAGWKKEFLESFTDWDTLSRYEKTEQSNEMFVLREKPEVVKTCCG